ncbi:MAG: Gfo/Idh/MocA family oxidoreductase [Lentisphaeria bacterium]
MKNHPKTYVLVGLGGRSSMYQDVFLKSHREAARLLAVCDSNEGRLALAADRLKAVNPGLGTYLPADFDAMIREHAPDTVIVCSMDSSHDAYICRALELGCDVITEKPMTTDEQKCQRILDTCRKTGRTVRVTFNYRYSPARSQIKELLSEGIVGTVLSVSFQWLLDTAHGADYYRRWHRNKANSGGLLVHKATHHFDLVNWWLGTYPERVYASGRRAFYTEAQAARYGLANHGARCLACPEAARCNFHLDLTKTGELKALYLDQEHHDGYFRDRCVFDHACSDIEDVMNVVVDYHSGAQMSYSLNAFTPFEGYRIEFNGTKGRLEHVCQESSYVNGDGGVQGGFLADATRTRVYPHFQPPRDIPVRTGEGGHGGGDTVMLNDIFGVPAPDPLRRSADQIQGAYSVLVGIAANRSMASGAAVRIGDLVTGLPDPGFSPVCPGDDRLAYAADACRKWL